MTEIPTLPDWPQRTIAVLVTIDVRGAPHAIPVSAPLPGGPDTILLSLHRTRDSLRRLRERPGVAMVILAEGDVAFTARGTARVVAEPMPDAPDYAAVEITVAAIDDHRQPAFTVAAGIDRTWLDDDEKRALGHRIGTLELLAAVKGDPR